MRNEHDGCLLVVGAKRGQHDALKYVRMGAFDEGSTWNQIVHEYYIIILTEYFTKVDLLKTISNVNTTL